MKRSHLMESKSAKPDTVLRCPQCPHRRVVVSLIRIGGKHAEAVERALCAWCGWKGTLEECPA